MPTFEDPAVDAENAQSALAHVTRSVHPIAVDRGLSL